MEGEERSVSWSRGVRVAVRISDEVLDLPPTQAGQIDLGAVAPVRGLSAWPGRRAYSGSWWLASLRRSVDFASLTERDTLLMLDSTHRVVAVTARPLSIRWPEEAGLPSCKPSFFVRYSNGDEELICSSVPDHRSALEFEETTGWRLRKPPRVGTIPLENARWLAGYRFDRFRPALKEQAVLQTVIGSGSSLATAARNGSKAVGAPAASVTGWIYALLWLGVLHAQLESEPLSSRTVVES